MAAGINLPDLVQKVKVDTSSMALATRRATAMGAKFKEADRKVTQAQKNMDRAFERSNTVMKKHREQQSAVARAYASLSKQSKTTSQSIELSTRGVKDAGRAMKEFARSSQRVNANLKETTREINDLSKSSTKASASVDGIGSGMGRASRRSKQFRRDAESVGEAVRDIPSLKDVDINITSKGLAKARKELEKMTEARDVEIDAVILGIRKAEAELAEISEDREVEIAAKVSGIRKANAELGELIRERETEIRITLENIAKAEAELKAVSRTRTAKINVDVDKNSMSKSTSLVESFFSKITGGGGRGGKGGIGFMGAGLFTNMIKESGKLALSLPIKAFEAFGGAVSVFQETFSTATKTVAQGGQGMGKIAGFARAGGAAFSALGSAAASGAVAVVLLVPAAFAVSAAFGAMASAISLAGGMLTAFVGIIGTAIVAPLLAAIPLLGAFGVGALVAGGAIATWAKNSNALEQAMKPIKSELKSLAKELSPTLDGLTKLFGDASVSMIRDFGDSTKNVLDDFYLKLKDPSMKQFYDQWSVKMPSIFEYLGKAVSSFATGLVSFFVPILPYAEKLAMNIKGAADSFNLWAQSKKGQKTISDWMADAWDLSTKLWSGLKDIGAAILDIFGIGVDESGNDFATWVRDIGKDFKTWTESEKGREDIKQWFKDAEKLARDVKDIIKGIGEIFDTLDSPAGRTMLGLFMSFIRLTVSQGVMAAKIMNGLSTAWLALQPPNLLEWARGIDWGGIGQGIKDGLSKQFELMPQVVKDWARKIFTAFIEGVKERLGIASPSKVMIELMGEVGAGIVQGLAAIPGAILGKALEIGNTIATYIGMGLNAVATKAGELGGKVMTAVSGLGGRLGTWALGVWTTARTNFGIAIGGVVTFATGLPGRVMTAVSTLGGRLGSWASTAWSTARTNFGTGVSTAVAFFTGVPGRIMAAVGTLGGRLGSWATTAWTSARTNFSTGVSTAVTFFTGVPGRIMAAVSSMGGKFTNWASTSWSRARTSFSTGVANAITFFTGVPGRVMTAVSSMGGKFSSWASTSWSRARSSFNTGISGTVTTFSGVPGRIISAISSMGGRFTSWASGAWRSASGAFSAGISSIIGLVATLPGRVIGAIGNMGSLLTNAGRDVVQGFMNGMNERINGVVNAAGGMASRVAAAVRAKLDSHSPSRVFVAIGKDTTEGFKIGIESGSKSMLASVSKQFGQVKSYAEGEISNTKWDSLIKQGWRGRPGDKEERIYAPTDPRNMNNDPNAFKTENYGAWLDAFNKALAGWKKMSGQVTSTQGALTKKIGSTLTKVASKATTGGAKKGSLAGKAFLRSTPAPKRTAAQKKADKLALIRKKAEQRYNTLLKGAVGSQSSALKAQAAAASKIGVTRDQHSLIGKTMESSLKMIKQVGQNVGVDGTIPFVEGWYADRKKVLAQQDKQILSLTEQYEKRKLITQQKTATVKDIQSQRTKILNGSPFRPTTTGTNGSTSSTNNKNINVNVTNNNPVAEKSSQSAVRNLTNIAQLVNW